MNAQLYLNFMLHAILVTILIPSAFTDHRRFRRRVQQDVSSTNTNHIQNVPEVPAAYSTFTMQRGNSHIPDESSNFVTKHEYQPRALISAYHQSTISPEAPSSPFTKQEHHHHAGAHNPHLRLMYPPLGATQRQNPEKETQFQKKKFNPEYNYILTASGKEDVYTEDIAAGYKLRHFDPSHPPEGSTYMNKKHEKPYKKHRYAYTNHRGESGLRQPESGSEIRPDAGHHEESKSRIFNFPENQNYPQFIPPPKLTSDKTEIHRAKSASWTQLGPNVEISSSAEHPAFAQKLDRAQEQKLNKKRKNIPKNVRTGYMNPQHALYVATDLQNIRPPKAGAFDHNNVLKQSDKFEITDAMFQELEQEARKTGDAQIRIKQESPKDQVYRHQPELNSFQYYSQPVTPLLNVAPLDATTYSGKLYQPYPLSAFSKGFVRNIEIETNSSGGKKLIPALIIPLPTEQFNAGLLNSDVGLYVNNPDVLNPGSKVKNVNPFPYDIINARYTQNDVVSAVVPVENYHYQNAAPFGFEAYSPYLSYQNHNIFTMPFMNDDAVSSTPANVDTRTPPVAYSTQAVSHQEVGTRSAPPYSASFSKKTQKSRHQKPQGQQQLNQSNQQGIHSQSQLSGHSQSQFELRNQQQLGLQNQPQSSQQSQLQLNYHNQLQPGHQSQSQRYHSEFKKSDTSPEYSLGGNSEEKYSSSESSHFTTVAGLKERDEKSFEKSETRRN